MVVPAMNEYLEHHRTCGECARRLGLGSGMTCLPSDWCDVEASRLCERGRELLGAWGAAAMVVLVRGSAWAAKGVEK